mmetsp:Transcript_26400/g.44216  ORF Transcript_26400/g.44216 Transcript_26400/m.44216 type:complete len:138 (-) Transcript_26400:657-1070(-)|eukprot:CAMPEP_0198203892 /NCGR_PEP_ID=MMETSP1445-20131203/7226_1 /TAXON_ID=36898 /ORGANISM="Pyramimonas sp., Strain CCMP2087" /LENGTH=137 /DNA_ID=CAMNT_0043875473 /DNA_START=185 /DNA_END=598 /DNA_ORIENTATION=+
MSLRGGAARTARKSTVVVQPGVARKDPPTPLPPPVGGQGRGKTVTRRTIYAHEAIAKRNRSAVAAGRSHCKLGKGTHVGVIPWNEPVQLKFGECWIVSYEQFKLVDEEMISRLHEEDKMTVVWTQEWEQTFGAMMEQ